MPSDFDRLLSGYRLTQTALLTDPYCIGMYEGPALLEFGVPRPCSVRFFIVALLLDRVPGPPLEVASALAVSSHGGV